MRTRYFLPGEVYRLVEVNQPINPFYEEIVNQKIRFLITSGAKQDQTGMLHWTTAVFAEVLTGKNKGMAFTRPPPCRLLKVRERVTCSCDAYSFPHRPGRGKCEAPK